MAKCMIKKIGNEYIGMELRGADGWWSIPETNTRYVDLTEDLIVSYHERQMRENGIVKEFEL